jgi:uncharacterized membrane protein YphA (DoxX/SURF4 family)
VGNDATLAVVWVARIVLAAVFGYAAVTKFRDPVGSARGAQELDVPERFVSLVGRFVPLAETCVALAIVVPPLSAASAAVGLVLLVAFTAAVVRVLSKGRVPMCFCFGSRNAQPANRDAVVRNIALAALCIVVMVSS